MKLQYLSPESLEFWDENPRTIDQDQFTKLKKSMTEDPNFLELRPILVNLIDGAYLIYAGNQRVRAAVALKMDEIPCIVDEDLPDEVMRKRSILDNKTYGQWDLDMLANEWDTDFLLDCGFTDNELCFEKKDEDKPKVFKIIMEFESEDNLNQVLPEINKFKSLCQMKVKV